MMKNATKMATPLSVRPDMGASRTVRCSLGNDFGLRRRGLGKNLGDSNHLFGFASCGARRCNREHRRTLQRDRVETRPVSHWAAACQTIWTVAPRPPDCLADPDR